MRFSSRSQIRGFCCILIVFFAGQAMAQLQTNVPGEFVAWLPVTDAERQMKTPLVDKDAGAEVLFWHVHVVDDRAGSDLQRNFYNYVRLKIFDEKGKARAATIDLGAGNRSSILDVGGRTVKPDGSVIELGKNAVFQRDSERSGGIRRKVTSFAMPGVEPGAIVEYRWRERLDDNRIMYLRLQFQREFPVEKVTYFVKPLSGEYTAYQMYLMPFNSKPTPFKLENDGYNSTTVENVPAERDEPFSPSDPNVRPWALLFYSLQSRREPDKYWNDYGKKAYNDVKAAAKSNDDIKSAAAQATAGAKSDEEKIVFLIAYVRKNLRNLFDSDVPAADRDRVLQKMPKERLRTAPEILKSGLGTSYELNIVLAAMALQAGLEAKPAFVADWNQITFSPKVMVDDYFLDNIDVAVNVHGSWKVYDVGSRLLAPDLLPWREEGVYALLSDSKTPSFVETPVSPPEASQESKVARLQLELDGSLNGDVEESFTGHKAEDQRAEIARESDAQRQEWLRDRVNRMFPNSSVSEISLRNVDDPALPLQIKYHLDAPGYAQATGKRVFVQPLPFERALASPFSAAARTNNVQFRYAWRETDQIVIKLPPGFVLDSADAPGNLNFGKPGGYKLLINFNSGTQELVAARELTFGASSMLFFDRQNYPTIKKIFDEIHARDTYSVALKQAGQ